ncbi:MAG: hypothetical protein B6D73_14380 [gamma proteobacterium symbiont of Stewartia floridana]|nr:MAG: hypothetical protein B6D73_14380 [gamma proteobacterium symbiont of Stewartia floridana]
MKKSLLSFFCGLGFIVSPMSTFADHAFLDSLNSQITANEIEMLFSGEPYERIDTSYELYLKGDANREDVISFWNRIYNTADSENELDQIVLQIQEIGDSNLCLTDGIPENTKALSFRDMCR